MFSNILYHIAMQLTECDGGLIVCNFVHSVFVSMLDEDFLKVTAKPSSVIGHVSTLLWFFPCDDVGK